MGPAVDGNVSAADVAALGDVQQTPDRLLRSEPITRSTGNGGTLPVGG
jgi:hypothetical protein